MQRTSFITPLVALAARAAAVLGLLAGAGSASAQITFSYDTLPVAGGTFTLTLHDGGVPAAGYADSDLLIIFDTGALSFVGAAAGSAFGVATALATRYDVDFYGITLARDASALQPGPFGDGIVGLTFQVAAGASGTTFVDFFPNPALIPSPVPASYYQLDFEGAEALLPITAVPEPATAALLLAGIAITAHRARRRTA